MNVAQYTYLGVEIPKDCSWDAHIERTVEKGKAYVGKMDAILTNSHLATRRIKICILINVIVRKLGYTGEVFEEKAKSTKHLETVQMTAVKKYYDAQVRRLVHYYEQNWECAQFKQLGT